MMPENLAARQANYTERLYQDNLPEEPDEELPVRRRPPDIHDAHRCPVADPSDPWSESVCERPW